MSTVTANPNLQGEVVIINTRKLIAKELYYLEQKIEKLTLIYFSFDSCGPRQDSLARVMPWHDNAYPKPHRKEKESISTYEINISNKCKMVNKYVILPEINLTLRNSLLTNTREGGKVLPGIRYPNCVRIQKVPRSLSRKRAL